MYVLIEVQAASRPVKRGDVQGSVPRSPASSQVEAASVHGTIDEL